MILKVALLISQLNSFDLPNESFDQLNITLSFLFSTMIFLLNLKKNNGSTNSKVILTDDHNGCHDFRLESDSEASITKYQSRKIQKIKENIKANCQNIFQYTFITLFSSTTPKTTISIIDRNSQLCIHSHNLP